LGLFAQADQSLARSEGGLGIGLTLVRSLARLHGGTITATSDGPDKGSEFILRLPSGFTAKAQGPDSSKRPEKRPLRGLRVLVVDDNEDSAESMARLLKLTGHTVRVAHSGPAAIAFAREQEPEAVVLDIGLPGMDGYAVATQLRREECCKEALIIAVSGYGEEQARQRSSEAGFDHHLVKPVNFETLLAVMDRARDRSSN
jgi:CheY-like chemotaxis protein